MDEKLYLNWLYHVPGIGRKNMGVILSGPMNAKEIFQADKMTLERYLNDKGGYSPKQAQTLTLSIVSYRERKSPYRLWEEMQDDGIVLLLPGESRFPERLLEIPDRPGMLYMRGSMKAAEKIASRAPCVAVVGARECTVYGRHMAKLLGEKLAEANVTVVSGMAYGIDGIAQTAALESGGPVGAVLGCGVDYCYPSANRQLYDSLIREGCIYSEYLPGTEPRPNLFPPRNRLISGMADALVVVEAKEKSGTLITVDMALEQGREVYVLPGRLTDPLSRGCNKLVGQGAGILWDLDEFVEGLTTGLHKTEQTTIKSRHNNPYEEGTDRWYIVEVLDIHAKSVQQIYEALKGKVDIVTLQTELLFMSLDGEVEEMDGRFFVSIK